ncbi:TPA: efflux RND transporter periplasmic adaptor subunit [Candidatus Avigastranaerophilus faecigallinarum]|nr:efflux RND transporter periplasmic adaptor subunit [Candidatus Avigastranaerophilus faecigallinarum]
MKKKIVLIIFLLLVITGIIFFLTHKNKNLDELTLYGNIEIRQVDLSFQVSGQIEKMLKEEGDKVEKGELLATIDSKDYKTNLDKAQADVEIALALKNEAEDKFNRQAPLTTDNTLSKQDYDTLLNTKNKANADYNKARASKEFAQNQLDYTKIYAPDKGIITVRVQEPGATVNKGQIVYTMTKTTPVWIRAYVNETDLGNIKYGQKAKVYTDTINPNTGEKRSYEGYIGYISPVAEFTPKTVQSTELRTDLVYRIRVYIDNVDDYLKQGMPTTIKVDLKK